MISEKKRTKDVKEKTDLAIGNLMAGYSCSEAVILTYGEQFGLDRELAAKVASGFGGGMGGMGETCGAVTAAYMVIGLKYGAATTEDAYSRELTYESVARFAALFKARNGSTDCRDLSGNADLSTPDGRKYIREKGRVPQIVADAIDILEEIFDTNS